MILGFENCGLKKRVVSFSIQIRVENCVFNPYLDGKCINVGFEKCDFQTKVFAMNLPAQYQCSQCISAHSNTRIQM